MSSFFDRVNNNGETANWFIKNYCGRYIGIYNKINYFYDMGMFKKNFYLIAPNIPAYTKDIYGCRYNTNFHLAGFSANNKNSFIRAAGESMERYSHLMAECRMRKRIITSTYNELINKGYKVCPLKYINVFTERQLKNFKIDNFSKSYINEFTKVDWIACKSIYDDSLIWIPTQMFFLITENDTQFYMSVSTGTATHRNFKKALNNAIIEYLQVDSMIMSWYVKGKANRINIANTMLEKLIGYVGLDKNYEIYFIDMTLDKPIYVVGCFIKNKLRKYPYCTFGMQAGTSFNQVIYRSFMEAYANIGARFALNKFSSDYDEFCALKKKVEADEIYDLDDNVSYFLSEYAAESVEEKLFNFIQEERNMNEQFVSIMDEEELFSILKSYLKQNSLYACYLDITSDEFSQKDWYVVRTVIPELLPLCMPSMPFENHPRIKENSGITNRFIHPSP